jgi:two-component system, chemotaxis family, sensor kinase CheA
MDRLTLRAYHEGGQVNIEIGDDGAGIDVAQVKQRPSRKGCCGRAGRKAERPRGGEPDLPARLFNGAEVTNVSGRGVGMDVVKSNIEKIGGVVDVSSIGPAKAQPSS